MDGGILLSGGTWSFEPDADATVVRVEIDPLYFAYGWWERDTDTALEAGVFAFPVSQTQTVSEPSNLAPLTGTARYVGGATGHYAVLGDPFAANADSGRFVAVATLEADWGTDASPGTLSGSVHNFVRASDRSHLPWTLALDAADLTAEGAVGADASVMWTVGVDSSGSGQWEAQLHEPLVDSPSDGVPSTVLGEFAAAHAATDARIIGAFGATLSD